MGLYENWKRRSQLKTLYKAYKDLVGRTDRIAILQATELAILMDELEVWRTYREIPAHSYYIPTMRRGVMKIGDLLRLVKYNKEHLTPASRGIVIKETPIAFKDKSTGYLI